MTDLKICSSDITLEEIQEFCAMIENSGLGPCVLYLENAWLSAMPGWSLTNRMSFQPCVDFWCSPTHRFSPCLCASVVKSSWRPTFICVHARRKTDGRGVIQAMPGLEPSFLSKYAGPA